MSHRRKQYTRSVICKRNTLPAPNAFSVRCFGTPGILKALHTASSCPTSSAGVYFHPAVTVSYWAHSVDGFPEAQQAHSDRSVALQLPGKKARQALPCALSSFEQSQWHKGAQEICLSCPAAPEPAPAAASPWARGTCHRGERHWGQKWTVPRSLSITHLCLWELPEITASLYCSTCFTGLKDEGAATGSPTILRSGTSLLSTGQNPAPGVTEASSTSHFGKTKHKDKTDTNIILIFHQIYRNITAMSFLTVGKRCKAYRETTAWGSSLWKFHMHQNNTLIFYFNSCQILF